MRDEREILIVEEASQPGALGQIARKIADAGVNLDLSYVNDKGQLVLGVDDLEKARAAL